MYKKMIVLFLVAMSFAMLQRAAMAEFDPGQFAQNFNSFQSGGNTYAPSFILRGSGPAFNVTDVSAYGFHLNIGAYSSNRAGYVDPNRVGVFPNDVGIFTDWRGLQRYYYADDLYFSSFVLGSAPPTLISYTGRLSYDNGATRTSNGTAINLGIFYLYARYATNTFGPLSAADINEFNTAIQLLLSGSIPPTQWETNQFLSHLVAELGSGSVWRMEYDLNTEYPFLWYEPFKDYAVFVMNLTQSGPSGEYSVGDVLYLVKRDDVGGTSGVPEPASLLAWSAIGLGLFGAAHRRRKQIA